MFETSNLSLELGGLDRRRVGKEEGLVMIMRTTGRDLLVVLWVYGCVLQILMTSNRSRGFLETTTEPSEDQSRPNGFQDQHTVSNGARKDKAIPGDFIVPKSSRDGDTLVAIGMAISSRGLPGLSERNLNRRLPFFTTFLRSFCWTASRQYKYVIYVSFEDTDRLLSNPLYLTSFNRLFDLRLKQLRCYETLKPSLILVKSKHSRHATWGLNDAMTEAYLDGATYFFRLSDDTELTSRDWTGRLIGRLQRYVPSNVGVTGPDFRGDRHDALFGFVHRSHFEIFGCFYPRRFRNRFFADQWLSEVYRPDRSSKDNRTSLLYNSGQGESNEKDGINGTEVQQSIEESQVYVFRYISMLEKAAAPNPAKVIAMSLYGRNPRYTYGAIRNAQLAKVFFPNWALRVYVPECLGNETSRLHPHCVPDRIISVLQSLGVAVIPVDPDEVALPPKLWRHLVIDDPKVDIFIVRDAHARFSKRDACAVNNWIETSAAVHCIRDHPSHVGGFLWPHMWGGRTARVRQLLNASMLQTLLEYHQKLEAVNIHSRGSVLSRFDDVTYGTHFLSHILYPVLDGDYVCHDSVSYNKWSKSMPFPVSRTGSEYIGQGFDEHGQPLTAEGDDVVLENCVFKP